MTNDLRKQFKAAMESGETLVIDGNLMLDDDELFAVPFLRVRGDLTLKNMFNLHRIWGLEVAGDLTLESVDLIERLPRLCTVGKTLAIRHCTLLAELGEKLSCRALEVDSCTSVTIVELGIEQCRSITLKHLNHLEIVTQKRLTWIPSEVSVDDCGLVSVPSGLRVGTSLKVVNCDNLEAVGSEVFSGGDIDFSGCGRLTTLGSKLFCGANLVLRNTGLESLPEDMLVEGVVEVAGSPIKNLKQIGETTKVQWRGKNAGSLNTYPMEQRIAEDILKVESRSEREHQIRQLGVEQFLKAAGERFSRHRLDPDAVIKALQKGGNGASDLYYLSRGWGQFAYDTKDGNRKKLPKWNEAGIMMVPGWWEIRNTFQLDWHRN